MMFLFPRNESLKHMLCTFEPLTTWNGISRRLCNFWAATISVGQKKLVFKKKKNGVNDSKLNYFYVIFLADGSTVEVIAGSVGSAACSAHEDTTGATKETSGWWHKSKCSCKVSHQSILRVEGSEWYLLTHLSRKYVLDQWHPFLGQATCFFSPWILHVEGWVLEVHDMYSHGTVLENYTKLMVPASFQHFFFFFGKRAWVRLISNHEIQNHKALYMCFIVSDKLVAIQCYCAGRTTFPSCTCLPGWCSVPCATTPSMWSQWRWRWREVWVGGVSCLVV